MVANGKLAWRVTSRDERPNGIGNALTPNKDGCILFGWQGEGELCAKIGLASFVTAVRRSIVCEMVAQKTSLQTGRLISRRLQGRKVESPRCTRKHQTVPLLIILGSSSIFVSLRRHIEPQQAADMSSRLCLDLAPPYATLDPPLWQRDLYLLDGLAIEQRPIRNRSTPIFSIRARLLALHPSRHRTLGDQGYGENIVSLDGS
ncbi:hypothetical protein C8R42DRAFT_777686 [Lentinula raphanica]|nr:hypothetical protein C8R42DRAFT_777686 [Lentinula raphanica]